MNTITNLNTFPIGNSLDGVNIITEEINTLSLLVDGTNSMLADLNMNNHTIKNLEAGTEANEAVNKSQLDLKADTTYVNTQDNLRVLKTGDTMSGVLNMSSNKIINVANGTNNLDAVNKLQMDSSLNLRVLKTGDTITGTLNVNYENAFLDIRATQENQDSILYLSTPFNNGAERRKTAIIADGINSWSRANLHFCLNNAANQNNVSLSDSKMCILNSGNVGINTTNPTERLDVNGNSILRGSLNMNSNKIVNLSNGTSNTDAVNLSQLNDLSNVLSQDIDDLEFYVDSSLNLLRTYTDNSLNLLRTYVDASLNLLRNDLTDDINDLRTYTDSSLNLLRTYVDTQDNLKVNKSGDTMTNYLQLPEIRLTGQTTNFGSGSIDSNNRTNTYAVFGEAGTTTDWAFLRQIGGINDIHLSLDFHDDENDGKFSLRSIKSTANPDDINTFFYSSPSGTNIKGLLEIERDNTQQILLKSNSGGIQEDTGIKFNHSTKDVGLIEMRTVDTLKANGAMSLKVIKNNVLQTLFYVEYDEVGCLNSLNLNLNKIRNLDGGTNFYDAVNKGQLDLKSDTTYVNTQLATKVNKSGDTMTGDLTVNENLSVIKKINSSHIQLQSGANVNSQGCWIDWNFNVGDGRTNILNQKGGGTGGIAFGEVSQTNVRTYNMILDGNGNLSVAGTINRSSWLSGELIQTKIYNQNNSGSGVLTVPHFNNQYFLYTWKDLFFTTLNTPTDSIIEVTIDAPYLVEGHGLDYYQIRVYDITGGGIQTIIKKTQFYSDNGGGGTRGSSLLPTYITYTPQFDTSNKTRFIRIDFYNRSLNDDLFICYTLDDTQSNSPAIVEDKWSVKITEYKK